MDVLRRFPEVRSVYWAVNDTPAERTNLPSELLWGDEAIEEEILGLRFRIRPGAFFQTNTEMAAQLYELAREYAALEGSENVFDLYCGTGTIGLALAGGAKAVWGVEISEESVACAIENAELNGIENARFFAGNVGQSLEELQEQAGRPDVVVVDPPRAGLAGKALRRTGGLAAGRIVYVSCNPTHARLGCPGASRRVRLRARAHAAGGHVPAHAARRVGLAARASDVGATQASPLRASRRFVPRRATVAHVAPEQVGVRDEEAEADSGERGEPERRPTPRRARA